MKIYLTRHGETKWNTENRLQGCGDSPLTEKGIRDAKLLGQRLANIDIETIYTSTSPRAVNTANIIRGERDIGVKKRTELTEMDIGYWQGRTLIEIKRDYPREYHNYWNAPHLYKGIYGGETFYEVQKRAIAIIEDIINKNEYNNILIISHGVTIKSILTYYQGKPMKQLWDKPIIIGASLSLLEIGNGGISIPLLGDTQHLL